MKDVKVWHLADELLELGEEERPVLPEYLPHLCVAGVLVGLATNTHRLLMLAGGSA